jgi:hypothetical protein
LRLPTFDLAIAINEAVHESDVSPITLDGR